MNSVIKSKGGIISLKKKYYNQFLTKNDNNNNINVLNSVNIPYSFNNYQCMCVCHEEKAMNNNNLYNYNSEIINSYISESNLDKRQYQKILLGRNRSANYLLALKNKDLSLDPSKVYSTNYNYNFNYFDNVGNGILKKKPKSQEKMNNLYQNEKINININQTDNVEKTDNLQKIDSMNEIKNNLNKSSIVHKNENENENKSVNEADINKNILYRSYHDAKPSKYSYGGRTIIVSSNAKNHTFKEIIVKSGSSDKILNKKKFIKLTENNIYNSINNNNYNEKNCYKSNNNTEINNDINYNFNTDENKNENNNNINHREIKKSTSDNYLFNHHHIHHIHRCRCHCINHMNYFRDINNCNQNNDIYLMTKNKDKYKLNIYDYYNKDNILTSEKENKCNNIYTPIQTSNYEDNYNKYHIPTEVFNSESNEIFNNCNNNNKYNYKVNEQNYYYKNKRTIPKSNSFDNYNLVKKNYKNSIIAPKNSAIWDFNYNNFKLKVKLGLLKKEIYKNEKNNITGNKNRIQLNYQQQDKKYLENILNNKKKSNIKDIVLEKTKKALEEKKLKQENKYNNKNLKNYKYKYKNENKILSNLKKQLLENNKKNNKYVVKPKLNVFK